MYAAAERAGVLFEVHQNRRWDDDFLTVRKIAESGIIGSVYKIESRVTGGNGIPGAWRKEKARGGGMMLDWGVHLIDQMLMMVRSSVKSLYCEYSYIYGEEVEDGFHLTVSFENGIRYRIVVATDCFRNLPRWQVYGTEGTARRRLGFSGGMTRIVKKDASKRDQGGQRFTRTMAPRADDSFSSSAARGACRAVGVLKILPRPAPARKSPPRRGVRVMRLMEAARVPHRKIIVKKKL